MARELVCERVLDGAQRATVKMTRPLSPTTVSICEHLIRH
jgi:hypothetical protein